MKRTGLLLSCLTILCSCSAAYKEPPEVLAVSITRSDEKTVADLTLFEKGAICTWRHPYPGDWTAVTGYAPTDFAAMLSQLGELGLLDASPREDSSKAAFSDCRSVTLSAYRTDGKVLCHAIPVDKMGQGQPFHVIGEWLAEYSRVDPGMEQPPKVLAVVISFYDMKTHQSLQFIENGAIYRCGPRYRPVDRTVVTAYARTDFASVLSQLKKPGLLEGDRRFNGTSMLTLSVFGTGGRWPVQAIPVDQIGQGQPLHFISEWFDEYSRPNPGMERADDD